MFTYVKGTQGSYELGKIISNPVNVYGLSESPTPPVPPALAGQTFHYLYSDIRPLYGVPIFTGDPAPTADDVTRKKEGFWWLEYVSTGNTNSKGEQLEYVTADGDPVVTFQEDAVGSYKALTALKTFKYKDMDLAAVKEDLKQRTITARDVRVDGGYHYKTVEYDVTFSTDMNGRQMLNNYYSQAVNGSQTITIYMPESVVKLTGDQMIELFGDVMDQIDQFYDESIKQSEAIDAATTIYDAQKAATWVYDGTDIPVRS